jgi:hypothetical protein
MTLSIRRLVMAAAMLYFHASCQETGSPPAAPPDLSAMSPTGAARQLVVFHKRKSYDELARGIVPENRQKATQFIRAIDEVLDANESLKGVAEARFSGPVAETWSLTAMANNLGLFSRVVTFLGEEFVGNRSYVTLQEGDQIPLIHAEFRLEGGHWLYCPESIPDGAAAEVSRLAGILRELQKEVQAGQRVDQFAAAFESRVTPQIWRVVHLQNIKLAAGTAEP